MDTPPAPPPTSTHADFPCKNCGAKLSYAPGTTSLTCPYCHTGNDIALKQAPIEELDYLAALHQSTSPAEQAEVLTIACHSCAAKVTLPPNTTADNCPFCGSPIIAEAASHKLIKPRSVLPFAVDESKARQLFGDWTSSLWFAPSAFTREAGGVKLRGLYIPAWTYDSRAETDYTGQRGDDYWETETYWDTETYTETQNGQTVTKSRQVQKTRQVRKTRWSYAAGHVSNAFDDLLVLASTSLPANLAQKLEPWDLPALIPYQDEFLSGFICETYSIDLEKGFGIAQQLMVPDIRQTVCRDIGGDHQQISTLQSKCFDVTYKHILLPVWMCAYLYRGETYRFLINARTGEVQGERPYSVLKITLLIGTILTILIAIIATIAAANAHPR